MCRGPVGVGIFGPGAVSDYTIDLGPAQQALADLDDLNPAHLIGISVPVDPWAGDVGWEARFEMRPNQAGTGRARRRQ